MKQQILNWAMVVGTFLLISCNNTATTASGSATGTTEQASGEPSLQLPALKQGDEIVFEDDKVRIVEGATIETEDGVYNTFSIQPKNASYKQFSV